MLIIGPHHFSFSILEILVTFFSFVRSVTRILLQGDEAQDHVKPEIARFSGDLPTSSFFGDRDFKKSDKVILTPKYRKVQYRSFSFFLNTL